MSERTELAQKYIQNIKGTETEPLLKMISGTNEPRSLDYLLGAEKITLRTIEQLQDLNAPQTVLFVWSQVLADLSFEIEQIETFKGNE